MIHCHNRTFPTLGKIIRIRLSRNGDSFDKARACEHGLSGINHTGTDRARLVLHSISAIPSGAWMRHIRKIIRFSAADMMTAGRIGMGLLFWIVPTAAAAQNWTTTFIS